MKYLPLFCLLLLCFFSCKKKSGDAPTPVLDSPAYGFFPGAIGVNDLSTVFTNDGNIAISGTSVSGKILLLKLSQTGNQLLRKEITVAATPAYSGAKVYSLVQTTDNGYMMCGSAYGAGTSSDVFLLKLNSSGEFVWAKTYGGNMDDYGNMMIRTRDGNYLLCGFSYSYTTEPYDDIYLVKVNQDGDTLWTRSYAKHEQQTPFHLLETKNGDFVVSGTDEPTGDGRIIYLLRVDANGNKLWDNSIGPVDISHWKWGYCSAECSNGDLMVCGETDSKVFLARTDKSGNMLWEKTYTNPDSTYRCGMSMKIEGGNCLITGGSSEIIYSSQKCFLLKTDENGNELFSKTFPGTGSINGMNLLVNSSGDNIITGYQFLSQNNENIFFTRTDANGNYK